MIFDIMGLLKDEVITKDDLEGFSQELLKHIDFFIDNI